jgi:hypothetical protein
MNNTIWKLTFAAVDIILAMGISGTLHADGKTNDAGKLTIPFDPDNFPNPTHIDNPLFPLVPGQSWTFVSETGEFSEDDPPKPLCEVNTSWVLSNSQVVKTKGGKRLNPKTIRIKDGHLDVVTVYDVVWTTECDNTGRKPRFKDLEEVTFDWYIQDGPENGKGKREKHKHRDDRKGESHNRDDRHDERDHDLGNVWYVGEWTYDCEDGDCLVGEGSWETRKDGAKPGIVMLAHPEKHVGQRYDQEFYKGFAEDKAKVLRVKAWISLYRPDAVLPKDFHRCVTTKEFTPLDPDIEHKSYCPAKGNHPFPGGQVRTTSLSTGIVEERIQRTTPVPLPPNGFLPVPHFPPTD